MKKLGPHHMGWIRSAGGPPIPHLRWSRSTAAGADGWVGRPLSSRHHILRPVPCVLNSSSLPLLFFLDTNTIHRLSISIIYARRTHVPPIHRSRPICECDTSERNGRERSPPVPHAAGCCWRGPNTYLKYAEQPNAYNTIQISLSLSSHLSTSIYVPSALHCCHAFPS
jgi:hypothetical protein